MIEILKLIGSALVAASATLLSLYLKRKWEKQDKSDAKKEAEENKIDKIAKELDSLGNKVDSLSKEIVDIRREDTALESGLREILYDRIKFLCREHIAEGRIGEEDYNSLQRMWLVYHENLNGNGYLDSIMAEVEDLEKIK